MNRVVTFHPYGLLTLCKISEKSNDPIPRKLHYPWTRMDGNRRGAGLW